MNKDEKTELLTQKQSEKIYQESLASAPPATVKLPFSASDLRGDLDNIVLMSLRPETSRRYSSVEDLSKDISNYLNGLPVSARPNTFFYRASKFYARNKTASIVGLFLGLSLIGGTIATGWQSAVATRERDRAEKRFQDVRKLSNSLLFEITPKIERLQGSTEAREVLVKRALEYLDSLAADANDDLALQSELASAYEMVGELQGNSGRPNLGDFTGATESFLKANKIRQMLPQTIENQRLLAENHRLLSDVYFEQKQTDSAFKSIDEAVRIYEELVKQNPNSQELQTAYTKCLIDLAQHYLFNQNFDKSIETSNQVRTEIARLDSSKKEIQEMMVTNLTDLGYALSWNSRQSEAETEMAKAVELAEVLGKKYPDDVKIQRMVWRSYLQASAIYETIKDNVALKFSEKALPVAINAARGDSSDFQAKHNLSRSYYRHGICLANLEKFAEASFNLQTGEKILNELIKREPKNRVYQVDSARINLSLGELHIKRNDWASALKAMQNSVDIWEKILQIDPNNANAERDLAFGTKLIGDIQLKLSAKDKAKSNYHKSLEILTRLKNNKTLSEVDNKLIEEIKKKIAKY